MDFCFVPINLKLGASSCSITVISNKHLLAVRWCAENDYPDKWTRVDSRHIIKISKNGSYYAELTIGKKKVIKQFSVCHLKPTGGFDGGDGSPESPYLISTCAHFIGIRNQLSAHYRLISDLNFARDMKNLCWIPIGGFSQKEPKIDPNEPLENQDLGYRTNYGFTGELDGNGHTISGLTCNHPKVKEIGIFGSCGDGAYIHDVVIKNCSFSGTRDDCVGTISGCTQDTVIERCYLEKISLLANLAGGGVIGHAGPGTTIRACQFVGNLSGKEMKPLAECFYLGGIAGYAHGDMRKNTQIEDCCVKAKIDGSMRGSGITAGAALVSRCLFSGTVAASLRCAGIVADGMSCFVQNCVCVNTKINYTKAGPISVQEPVFVVNFDKDGTQLEPERIENAWSNSAGRIMCDDYTLLPTESRFLNYCTSSCELFALLVKYPFIDGSLRDGVTISEDKAYNSKFYSDLGWNFDNIWEIGTNGLPQIRRKVDSREEKGTV